MFKWNNTGGNYRLHIQISIWGCLGHIGSFVKTGMAGLEWPNTSLSPETQTTSVGALRWWRCHICCLGWRCLRHLWTFVWNRFSCACRVLMVLMVQKLDYWIPNNMKRPFFRSGVLVWEFQANPTRLSKQFHLYTGTLLWLSQVWSAMISCLKCSSLPPMGTWGWKVAVKSCQAWKI